MAYDKAIQHYKPVFVGQTNPHPVSQAADIGVVIDVSYSRDVVKADRSTFLAASAVLPYRRTTSFSSGRLSICTNKKSQDVIVIASFESLQGNLRILPSS